MAATATATVTDTTIEEVDVCSKQLRKLMVQWRRRLRREEITGLVNRKGQVTQEEMAFLCGLAHSHYGALERGRVDRNYSDATLDTVARVARLSTSERVALYLLAAGREPKPRPYAPPQITAAIIAQLDCQPWPAYLVNSTWDLLARNNACQQWLPHIEAESNIMRAIFCLPELRAQLVEWESVHAPRAIAQLRAQLTRMPHHDRLKTLIREILNACPDIRAIWAHDPTVWMHDDGDQRQIHLPGAVEPTTVEVLAQTPMRHPDLRVISLVPIDGYIPVECREHTSAHAPATPDRSSPPIARPEGCAGQQRSPSHPAKPASNAALYKAGGDD